MTAIANKLLGHITRKLLRSIAVIIMLGIYGGGLIGITALTSVATSTEATAGGRGRGRGHRGRGRGHRGRGRGRGHRGRGRGRGRRGCWYPGYYDYYGYYGCYGSGLNIWIR